MVAFQYKWALPEESSLLSLKYCSTDLRRVAKKSLFGREKCIVATGFILITKLGNRNENRLIEVLS
jgi:hypothetical protein